MKRINITCPVCGSKAFLRPASVVYGDKAPDPDAKYYVCGRYPACDCYVAAHRKTMLPMGTLADKALRKKRHDAHMALDSLWKNGVMSRKEAYRLLQLSMGLPAEEAHKRGELSRMPRRLTLQQTVELPESLSRHFLSHPLLSDVDVRRLVDTGCVDEDAYTSMLLWFLAAGGDGHRLIFGGCDEVGAYMELTLWHNTAHAESFQFYLSDYPCPGYAE